MEGGFYISFFILEYNYLAGALIHSDPEGVQNIQVTNSKMWRGLVFMADSNTVFKWRQENRWKWQNAKFMMLTSSSWLSPWTAGAPPASLPPGWSSESGTGSAPSAPSPDLEAAGDQWSTALAHPAPHRKEGNIQTTVNTANKTCTVASVNLRFSVQKRKTDLIFWVTVQFRTYDPEMPKSLGWGQRFWRSMCKICCFYALLWGSYKYRICNIL